MGVIILGHYCAHTVYTPVFYISRFAFASFIRGIHSLVRKNFSDLSSCLRKSSRWILAFCWTSGLVFGIFFFLAAGDSIILLMRRIPLGTVSIVSLLGITTFPFLLSFFVVSISKPIMILPISFLKAFTFSFVSLGILHGFGLYGWLLRYLLLFTDCASVPLLYLLWQRNLADGNLFLGWKNSLYFLSACLIGSLDYCIISPYLVCLIEL